MIKYVSGPIELYDEWDEEQIDPINCGIHINNVQISEGFGLLFDNEMVYTRLAFSDNPITKEDFLNMAIEASEGFLDASCFYEGGYSEYTPGFFTEYLNIGNHHLIHYLEDKVGSYVFILMSNEPISDLSLALEKAENL